MVKSMFAAVAGLRAHQGKMDVIGNNIANVNTYGYKTARATFRDVFYATTSGASEAGEVWGGTNPNQLGYGASVASIDSIMTGGGVAATDNPMDCMIIGNGFFAVGQRPQKKAGDGGADPDTIVGIKIGTLGPDAAPDAVEPKPGSVDQTEISKMSLTRVGIFNFDGQGNLVDSNGRMVYGFPAKYEPVGGAGGTETEAKYKIQTGVLTALKLPNKNKIADPGAGAPNDKYEPMELKNITIGKDGTIIGTNDKDEVVTVGQIAIINVPNPNALERQEKSYYKAKANTGIITVNRSGQNSTGDIQSGVLEMSNVDLSREFTDMITTQRGFQANTRIVTVTDQMLEELVSMKR